MSDSGLVEVLGGRPHVFELVPASLNRLPGHTDALQNGLVHRTGLDRPENNYNPSVTTANFALHCIAEKELINTRLN